VIIAHDLAVIRHMSDRVAVMYLGQIVELGTADEVFANPRHPYTRALLSAVPEPVYGQTRDRIALKGETPSPANPPAGCRFHTRCPFARPDCATRAPELREIAGGHSAACHYSEEISAAQAAEVTPEPPRRSAGAERRFAMYAEATSSQGA